MVKYAVMTFMFKSWWQDGRITHENLLQGIARAGAQGVEPFHRDFVDDPGLLPRYRRALSDNGLSVAAVDVMANLVHANREQQRQGRDDLLRGLDIAHQLGAEIAHVAGHKLQPGIAPADGRKMIAEGLLEVADEVQSQGMTLAIENFNPSPDLVCSAADCREIITLTNDRVGFVFDTGNFIAVQEQADAVFDRMADLICHCHFKDFKPDSESPAGYRSCDLGEGAIPNASVARRLRERGYDRWIALETYGRNHLDPVSAVKLELPALRSWFED